MRERLYEEIDAEFYETDQPVWGGVIRLARREDGSLALRANDGREFFLKTEQAKELQKQINEALGGTWSIPTTSPFYVPVPYTLPQPPRRPWEGPTVTYGSGGND